MKKILGILAITGAVCFFTNNDAAAGTAVNGSPMDYSVVQDTNPMPRRDSTKWNRKKSNDSTGRSRRDTLHVR